MDIPNDKKSTRGWAPDLLKRGWFWAGIRWGTLAAMAVVMAAAWGRHSIKDVSSPDPLMYTNLGNLTFWVLWLMGIVLLVPLAGRAWCSVCPLGALNEFASRFGLKRVVPRFMRNQFPKALILLITLILMGVLSIHHYPDVTAWYLVVWAAAAVAAGILFAGRSLCAYLCPVGGMLGLYGRTAPLAFGVREDQVCRDCEERECVRGAVSWLTARFGRLKASLRVRKNPCPVNLRVWDLDGTDRCLMCFNCMRACPLDNVALFGRKPVASLWTESYPRFSDTVLLAVLMGFIVLTYSRFWPPLQRFMALPVQWANPYLDGAAGPVLFAWLGFGLPLIVILAPALLVAWGRTNSAAAEPSQMADPKGGFPLRVWVDGSPSRRARDPDGEERVVGTDTVSGLSSVYAPALVPFLLCAHLVLAVVKLNAKLPYFPITAADPAGVRAYMAIWELGLMKPPGMLLPISVIRTLSVGILLLGTGFSLRAYAGISSRQGRGALPMLFPMLALAAVVYGGFYQWLF